MECYFFGEQPTLGMLLFEGFFKHLALLKYHIAHYISTANNSYYDSV